VVPEIQTLDAISRDPVLAAAVRREYDEHKTGPFAEGGAYSFAHWPLQLFNTPDEQKELRALLQSSPSSDSAFVNLQHRFIDRMILDESEASATTFMVAKQRYTAAHDPAPGNYMTILAMLSHPYSRGSCHIRSIDWREQPVIDCAYLSHPLDIEILARHVLQIERLLSQDALAALQKKNGNRTPVNADLRTLEGIKEAIRAFGAANYHLCGTCAMARDEVEASVVDGELLVRGTTNLRVCDASIFPIIPRGNILSSVYAVAEKASEFLLERYS
jgi:choline dehydrogenase-like flavoprotein